jgi:membrane fusion protein (multidrug efflux system)
VTQAISSILKPLTCVILLSLALLLNGCKKSSGAPQNTAAIPVIATQVSERDVPLGGDWVATLDGFVNAEIRSLVSGYLVRQTYREGSVVHAGDVLFEIDPRPFQATLNQAQGQLASSRAQLELAKINVDRDTPLAAAHAIAQRQLDTEIQQKAVQEAAVQTAAANLEQARLNLGFTKVRSLVTGIAGRTESQVGNLVSPSTTLTSVSQVDPIKAYFSISEQEYLALSKGTNSQDKAGLLQAPGSVSLQLVLGDGSVYPYPGRIIFVDRQINPQTGTIQIAGAFPNPRKLLRPGQFGRIKAETAVLRHALVLPARAVNELQGTYQVAVIDASNTVQLRPVKLDRQIGSEWIITEGLRAGERVVVEGVSKLRTGMKVQPELVANHAAASANTGAGAKAD